MGHLLNMQSGWCLTPVILWHSLPCGLLQIIACLCRTLFAPTNAAFESPDLKARTGLTAAQFLEPANKEALIKVRALPAHDDRLATGCIDISHHCDHHKFSECSGAGWKETSGHVSRTGGAAPCNDYY
jgi:hypothetical protein